MGFKRISGRLYASFALILTGFAISGALLFDALARLKVNGPLYFQLVEGRDLIADILPPPNYIIETYLVAYELRDCIDDPANVERLAGVINRLESEYADRHAYWENEKAFFGDNPAIRAAMVEKSYAPAMEFFRVLRESYLPAVRSGKRAVVDELLAGSLKASYDEHRKWIDEVVAGAREANASLERRAASSERRSLALCAAVCALTAIISAIVMALLARSILKPVRATVEALRAIGEGDLTSRVKVAARDEIGEMADCLNRTLDRVNALIVAINAQALSLSAIGERLLAEAGKSFDAAQSIRDKVADVKERTSAQSLGSCEASAAIGQIARNLDQLNECVETQSSSVVQASAAIAQMVESVGRVSKNLGMNAGNVEELSSLSDEGRSELETVSALIRQMAKDTESILDISRIIQDIASQTNLLSMNAAIEAAHAGDSGRGFAVVADEIRKLAESSGSQAKTASGVLEKVHGSMAGLDSATGELLRKFERIDSKIRAFAESERDIRNAMDEQSRGNSEIVAAMTSLEEISVTVKTGSSEMVTGAKEALRESSGLNTAAELIASRALDMESRAEVILGSSKSVHGLCDENRECADSLLREIGRFKVAQTA